MNLRRASRGAAALLLAAGCSAVGAPGKDASAPTRTPRAADRTTAAASPTVVGAAATPDIEGPVVIMGDHFIDPQTLVVKVGTTVTWRNSSGYHDVTSRDGLFRSPTLGEFYSHTFMQAGRFRYYCSFHQAEMRGEVIVEPAN